jgi:hypothetical protein
MEGNFENMENLFNDLDGYKVDPNPDVWNNIEKELGKKQMNPFNGDTFAGFRITPSAGLWSTISQKLWIHNFWRFTANQFNIFYAAGIVTAIVGAVLFLLPGEENNTNESNQPAGEQAGVAYFEKNSIFDENNLIASSDNDIIVDLVVENKTQKEDYSAENITYNNIVAEDFVNNDVSEEVNNSLKAESTTVDINENIDISNNTGSDQELITENNNQTVNITEQNNDVNVNDNPVNNESLFVDDKTDNSNTDIVEPVIDNPIDEATANNEQSFNKAENQDNLENNLNAVLEETKDETVVNISETSETKENNSNPVIDEANQDNSTVDESVTAYQEKIETVSDLEFMTSRKSSLTVPRTTDEVFALVEEEELTYPDTVGVDAKGDPIVIETTKTALEVFGGSYSAKSIITPNNVENSGYITSRQANESNGFRPVATYGMDYLASFKNWMVKTGVNYSSYGEDYKYNYIQVFEKFHYETFETGYYQYDTIMITNIDSAINGVDYQEEYIEETYVEYTDSNLIQESDTVDFGEFYSQNNYTYLEIPIMFGYELQKKKFNVSVRAGLINGIFLNSSGKTLSTSSEYSEMIINNKLPFRKYRPSAAAELSIGYNIYQNFEIFSEFAIRQDLSSIYDKSYNVSQKHILTGVKFGIRYIFDPSEAPNDFFKRL